MSAGCGRRAVAAAPARTVATVRRSLALLAVAIAALALAWSSRSRGSDEAPGATLSGRVVRVVDGDTIRVALSGRVERVRYIGIDTPESVKPDTPVQCYAHRAAAENARLVGGRRCGWCSTWRRATASGACSPTSTAPATACSRTPSSSAAATRA